MNYSVYTICNLCMAYLGRAHIPIPTSLSYGVYIIIIVPDKRFGVKKKQTRLRVHIVHIIIV